jgi:GNAT superfamily N-acetyltransferase
MIIRDYSEDDKKQILLLHDEFGGEFFPEFYSQETSDLEEKYADFVYQSGKFWVAEDQGLVVGYIGVQMQENDQADLIQLRVKKSHRRRGIGKLLIQKVEEYAVSFGKTQMHLHTAERLINARTLYEKCGYRLESSYNIPPPLEFTVMAYKKDLL